MRLWHDNSYKVDRKRYLNWGAGAAGFGGGALAGGGAASVPLAIIGGLGGLFSDSMSGMSKGRSGTEDILAPIREKLLALSSRVPGLVARRAGDIKGAYASARTKGLKNIAEDLYGRRGLGPTSLEPMYNLDLLTNLERGEQSDLTANELMGLEEESRILTGAAGQIGTGDEPSALSQILGAGANIIGQKLSEGTFNFSGILDNLGFGKPKGTTTAPGKVGGYEDFLANLMEKLPSSVTV